MKVRIQAFWLPKDGNTENEYEDAFLPDATQTIALKQSSLSVAIADGATETSFSQEWAKDLVAAYLERPSAFYRGNSLDQLIRDLGIRFSGRIEQTLSGQIVSWYSEQKAQEGAFAAVLGLTLMERKSSADWRASAIGDCCVFQIRNESLLVSFPMKSSQAFSNHPCLVSSDSQRNTDLMNHRHLYSGHWQKGDEFLLMTDALACWFLRRWELHSDPLELLRHVHSRDEFAELVVRERQERLEDGTPLLRNDDMTLMRCQIED